MGKKIGFYAFLLIASLPLLFLSNFKYGMYVPRIFLFWSIILIGCLALILKNKHITLKITLPIILFLLYFIFNVFSAFYAISPHLSFYSSFERMDGLLNCSFLALFFLLFSNEAYSKNHWKTISRYSCFVAFLVAIVCIFQHLKDQSQRVDGTLSNPLTLAMYLSFHFYIIFHELLFNLTYPNSTQKPSKLLRSDKISFFKKTFIGICILKISEKKYFFEIITCTTLTMYILAIIYTGSRLPFILLLLGMILNIIVILKFRISAKFIVFSGILLFICFKILNTFGEFKRLTHFDFSDTSGSIRLELYKMVMNNLLEIPFLGIGKENFIYFFTSNYTNGLLNAGTWFDRSHSIILDKLIEGGLVGLILYLGFCISIFFELDRLLITKKLRLILFTYLIMYHVFLLINFENFPGQIIIFTLLIFFVHNTSHFYKVHFKLNLFKKMIGLSILIGLFYVGILRGLIPYIQWNVISMQNPKSYNSNFEKALIGKHEIGISFSNNLSTVKFDKEASKLAHKMLNGVLTISPNHPVVLSQQGVLFSTENKYKDAIASFEKLRKIAPNRHINLVDLGMLYVSNREFKNALNTFDYLYKMDSSYKTALINKAYCFSIMGKPSDSNQILANLGKKIIIDNLDKCIEIYRLNNNYLGILKRLTFSDINKNPGYTPNAFLRWLQIAVILKENDEIKKAILTYLRYFYIDYDKAEIQSLISNIQSGKLPPEAFYQKFENIWWI